MIIWLIIATVIVVFSCWPYDNQEASDKRKRQQKHVQDKYKELNRAKNARIKELEKQVNDGHRSEINGVTYNYKSKQK